MRSFSSRAEGKVRSFLGFSAAVLSVYVIGYVPNARAEDKAHTIVIEAMQFSPRQLEVSRGDTLTWVNRDPFPHNVSAVDLSFRSKEIAPNGSWKLKMAKKGRFSYICTLHPTMKASFVVK